MMVAFYSILAVGTLVASTLAAPLHFSELGRRALPIGISVATARTYLSQREALHPVSKQNISVSCFFSTVTVAVPSNSPAYNRDFFNHWITSKLSPVHQNFFRTSQTEAHLSQWVMQHQRELVSNSIPPAILLTGRLSPYPAVLKRDGTNVVTDSSCAAVSGNWVSPYDNVATTLASDLDIVSGLNTPFPRIGQLKPVCVRRIT